MDGKNCMNRRKIMNRRELEEAIEDFKDDYNYNSLEISMILCSIARNYNPNINKESKMVTLSEIENKTCFKECD